MAKCDNCGEEFNVKESELIFFDYLWSKGFEGKNLDAEFSNWFDEGMCGWCNVGNYGSSGVPLG